MRNSRRWIATLVGVLLVAECCFAESVPVFEYYEARKAKVRPLDGKYQEDRKAESITASGNLVLPIYQGEEGGVILNGGLISIARTESVNNKVLDKDDQHFSFLNVFKAGLITYVKTHKGFDPIVIANYFNHPTLKRTIRPMYETYLGGTLWKKYTLLLRLVHHPHGNSFTPLLGWDFHLSENWTLDFLLPAHGKIIYTSPSKKYIWTTGAQGESRNFPVEVAGESGWLTGFHARLFSQIGVRLLSPIYVSLVGGGIMTQQRFFHYDEKTPTFAFREAFTPFLGFGLEAIF